MREEVSGFNSGGSTGRSSGCSSRKSEACWQRHALAGGSLYHGTQRPASPALESPSEGRILSGTVVHRAGREIAARVLRARPTRPQSVAVASDQASVDITSNPCAPARHLTHLCFCTPLLSSAVILRPAIIPIAGAALVPNTSKRPPPL